MHLGFPGTIADGRRPQSGSKAIQFTSKGLADCILTIDGMYKLVVSVFCSHKDHYQKTLEVCVVASCSVCTVP